MATLRNKRKLAAVSRETSENTRDVHSRNTIDPEMAQGYISKVSEEIEERVTKKISKEFSRTESRILGALSKLEEVLLNPQVRTCSVAIPGRSRNGNSENREPTEDRSLGDPYPEVRNSSHHSGNPNGPEAEVYPHSYQNGDVTITPINILCCYVLHIKLNTVWTRIHSVPPLSCTTQLANSMERGIFLERANTSKTRNRLGVFLVLPYFLKTNTSEPLYFFCAWNTHNCFLNFHHLTDQLVNIHIFQFWNCLCSCFLWLNNMSA